MRKIALFDVSALVILAGIGAWAASTTHARLETASEVSIAPLQLMMNSKELPVAEYPDYSLVFP
jgi:hypothetical protein